VGDLCDRMVLGAQQDYLVAVRVVALRVVW
jgi:hypothetical protein